MFHSRGWLEALRRTYSYEPIAYTTSSPSVELANGLVFCRIESRLTGGRLVSLPFSDHCEPLVESDNSLHTLLDFLTLDQRGEKWRYIEIRPLRDSLEQRTEFGKSATFHFHRMDIGLPIEALRRSLHKSCVQAKIRRAVREGLSYEAGRSDALLRTFYQLLLLTCRRRRLPPQPIDWFRHLIDCVGPGAKIHVVSKNERPVASILTLTFKQTLVYKYGCSDPSLTSLGGTQLLFWNAITDAKHHGLHEFDLGRSDLDAAGLVTFKNRWGAAQSVISYFRYPASRPRRVTSLAMRIAKPLFAHAPDRILIATGEAFYRHVG